MIQLILFGPPGSGKGTQAEKLSAKYGLYHISTGDLFRSETAQKTELGLKALEYMSKGMLVPDEITIGMLRKKLDSMSEVNGFIYDGFPRTQAQAEALDRMLAGKGETISLLLSLEVPEEEIVKRILNRSLTSGRPDDSDETIIRKRIQVYLKETSVVFDHYACADKSKHVDGLGSIEEIFNRLSSHIDPLC
ncbi:MAG TPA: adenylate kinase [Saprospiraceae bacterium]|nr:adenylate kinase [Saprospiraceae bacterium]